MAVDYPATNGAHPFRNRGWEGGRRQRLNCHPRTNGVGDITSVGTRSCEASRGCRLQGCHHGVSWDVFVLQLQPLPGLHKWVSRACISLDLGLRMRKEVQTKVPQVSGTQESRVARQLMPGLPVPLHQSPIPTRTTCFQASSSKRWEVSSALAALSMASGARTSSGLPSSPPMILPRVLSVAPVLGPSGQGETQLVRVQQTP